MKTGHNYKCLGLYYGRLNVLLMVVYRMTTLRFAEVIIENRYSTEYIYIYIYIFLLYHFTLWAKGT
jgi:hypothetical protein